MRDEISPLQAMVNGMSAQWQKARSERQMTLGKLIALLETLDSARPLVGLGKLDSYRGYYADLAFEPSDHPWSVGSVLKRCREAMGKVFEGYKGGDFQMGERTPLWVARWGECGLMLMGLDTSEVTVRPVTAEEP